MPFGLSTISSDLCTWPWFNYVIILALLEAKTVYILVCTL
jgi:hypothetical protein